MSTLTPNIGLIKPSSDEFYSIEIDNQNLDKIDEKVATKEELTSANKVKNLGFRGFLGDTTNGISPMDGISKYPEGISALYTDTSEWAIFFNITDFITTEEFLFIETHKTEQDGKINAVQEITRYKKETTGNPVKLIERFTRAWYSDANYSGWSNAEKAVSNAVFAAHLAEKASLTKAGHVQLNNATNSIDETTAATPKAVKAAYDRADAAFTSASNGKVLVRDAITGKGGTVADADGDGYPTFQELADGVDSISSSPKLTARGFDDFQASGIDDDDNLYGNRYGNTNLRKYSPDGTLLWSKTAKQRSVTKYGYTINNAYPNGTNIYNFDDVLIARLTNLHGSFSSLYREKGVGNLLVHNSNGIHVYDLSGNQLLTVSVNNFYGFFLNKKDTFIVVQGSGATLSSILSYYVIPPDNELRTYSGIGYTPWAINVVDMI